MATCFIFFQNRDEEQYLSLLLDLQGHLDAPLMLRSIQELKALQAGVRTVVVLPAENSGLHEVELPWLNEHKARAAIPYALEEQLAQDVSTLHVAFDRAHYLHHHYLVVIMDKSYLLSVMGTLDRLGLHYDDITLDWFALKDGEACVTARGLLINETLFKGALTKELAIAYLGNKEKFAHLLMFNDSLALLEEESSLHIDESSFVWIAKRLLEGQPMNLCQGPFQQKKGQNNLQFWYKASALVAGLWLLSMVVINGVSLYFIHKKRVDVDLKTAVVYRQFFPNASQIISPRFRVGQLLQSGPSGSDNALMWSLLNKLAHAFEGDTSIPQQLRFQGTALTVTLISNDFAALEHLEQRLQKENVKVVQTQAASEKNKVLATLELSLMSRTSQ